MTMRVPVEPLSLEPPRHNLLASARVLGALAGRWEDGITWSPSGCRPVRSWDPTCGEDVEKGAADNNPSVAEMGGLVYYLPYECVAGGFKAQEDQDRLEEWFAAGLPKAIEQQFWTATTIEQWSLTSDTPSATGSGDPSTCTSGVIYDGETTPLQALALLSQALADTGGGARGMIHASVRLATLWASAGYVVCEKHPDAPDREVFVTKARGDVIVVGSGYSGSGPGDDEVGSDYSWAYATPMVAIDVSEIYHQTVEPAVIVDRATNVVQWIAEAHAVVQVDPISYAVLVNLLSAGAGGGGSEGGGGDGLDGGTP